MDIFEQHEAFEIEVLDKMNSAKLLDPLVFGGGTMLRLCHELNRYSADLDFWFIKQVPHRTYFDSFQRAFGDDYEISDSQMKHFSLLFELRSSAYPKRLKIEIRRELKTWDYRKTIAFSPVRSKQVLVNAHTLEQTMVNKIQAFLDRNEIRDCFDIEFLIRRGVDLPFGTEREAAEIQKRIEAFKDVDFRVKLGSIVEKEIRDHYIENRFSFLAGKLTAMVSG